MKLLLCSLLFPAAVLLGQSAAPIVDEGPEPLPLEHQRAALLHRAQVNTFVGDFTLSAKAWSMSTQNIKKFNMYNSLSGSLDFDFPQSADDPSGSFIGYWTMLLGRNIDISGAGVLQATMKITTTGIPTFGYHSESGNTCDAPATIRFYFSDASGQDLHRWWSNPIQLTLEDTSLPILDPGVTNNSDGSILLVAPLTDPTQWTSVYGERASQDPNTLQNFLSTLKNVGNIGTTMGGGCFFGHGVNVVFGTGTAHMKLSNFRAGN